jgi:hypothetical protein
MKGTPATTGTEKETFLRWSPSNAAVKYWLRFWICQALDQLAEAVLDELVFALRYHRNQLGSFGDDVS